MGPARPQEPNLQEIAEARNLKIAREQAMGKRASMLSPIICNFAVSNAWTAMGPSHDRSGPLRLPSSRRRRAGGGSR